jgi:hypothetical protein
MNSINFLPIVVSSLVGFGLSSLWYSPILFGKEWTESQKFSLDKLDAMNKSNVVQSYILQFVFTLITFTVLAFIISMADVRSSTDGAFLGLLAWLGFIVPTSLSSLLWKKETFTLVLIDSINYLLILTIGGAIIGAWK